ncbi:MAG: DUF423 domain-containing protein [Thermaerobacter sp.]|nr:DUF423 domain-containing protein [Thermaerobacter sp.]
MNFVGIGAVAALFGVGLGAFGAHGLRPRLTPEALAVYQTGVQYHLYHALGLVGVGLWMLKTGAPRELMAAGWLFVAGIVLFSGSLYVLAATGWKRLGAVTPFGGLCFMAGWAVLALAAFQR